EQRSDAAPAFRGRRLGLARRIAVGAGIVRRVHQRNNGRRDRRYLGTRRARLIRRRRRAAAAFSRSTTEERAAARLLFIRALRFFSWALRLVTSEEAAGSSLLIRLPCSVCSLPRNGVPATRCVAGCPCGEGVSLHRCIFSRAPSLSLPRKRGRGGPGPPRA